MYDSCIDPLSGLADERGYYMGANLLRILSFDSRKVQAPIHANLDFTAPGGQTVQLQEAVGYDGHALADGRFVVDLYGLADNLLCRMPSSIAALCYLQFRPGHIPRVLPLGYIETVSNGKNQLVNTKKAALYDLHLVRQSPI